MLVLQSSSVKQTERREKQREGGREVEPSLLPRSLREGASSMGPSQIISEKPHGVPEGQSHGSIRRPSSKRRHHHKARAAGTTGCRPNEHTAPNHWSLCPCRTPTLPVLLCVLAGFFMTQQIVSVQNGRIRQGLGVRVFESPPVPPPARGDTPKWGPPLPIDDDDGIGGDRGGGAGGETRTGADRAELSTGVWPPNNQQVKNLRYL